MLSAMTADQPAIQTLSGHRLNPFAPDPQSIEIVDIAQALGNQCRFGGHCRHYYSVAQHSCLLVDLVDAETNDPIAHLWALLHDAAEAYLVDLPHPLKYRSELGAAFLAVELKLQAVICRRFTLPLEPPPILKPLDRSLLAAEKEALTSPGWEWPELASVEPSKIEIDPWLPERATAEFLRRYEAIAATQRNR